MALICCDSYFPTQNNWAERSKDTILYFPASLEAFKSHQLVKDGNVSVPCVMDGAVTFQCYVKQVSCMDAETWNPDSFLQLEVSTYFELLTES